MVSKPGAGNTKTAPANARPPAVTMSRKRWKSSSSTTGPGPLLATVKVTVTPLSARRTRPAALGPAALGPAALTGVEAISDGVPAFKKPEWMNARTNLTWMLVLLATMFGGITWLAHQYGSVPLSQHDGGYETVVSQIARTVFGGTNAAYYFIQFATMAILVLAANTAYSDFPRLAYFMARDRYLPSQFTFRGDRLATTLNFASRTNPSISTYSAPSIDSNEAVTGASIGSGLPG